MAELIIERHESQRIQDRINNAGNHPHKAFNEECAKLLKKKGIDNATPPFELHLNFPGASLIYHLAD